MTVQSSPTPDVGTAPTVGPSIDRVGIIGAGQMRSGIAHVCAMAGLPVVLGDVKPEALERALNVVRKHLDRQVAKGTLGPDDKAAALARITTTIDYAAFADCDLVIEAATEKEDVKRSIYKALTPHLKPSCMLASNTSSISITPLGASTD